MAARRRTSPPPAAPRSRSIDAAHPVDRDLFHQELVDVLVGQLLDVLRVLVLSQHPDLLWAQTQPIPGPGLPRLSSGPAQRIADPTGAPPGRHAAALHLHLERGPIDTGVRRWHRAPRRQPAPAVPDLRAGAAMGRSMEEWRCGW